MSNLAVIDPHAQRPALAAGARPQAIVPQSMEEAYRLANAVCQARMAPKGLDTPEATMVAILHGLEIGLTPMAALQRIAVVNGRPTIWGDGAMGLVRGSGLCEYVKERIEGEGDKRAAVCEAKRKGEAEPITRTFSVSNAKTAGLWDKGGPWKQYPERMLQMRARAFCLRDLFADVLGGLYIREEIEEEDDRAHRFTPPAPPKPAAIAVEHKPVAEAPAPAVSKPTVMQPPVPPKPPTPPQKAAPVVDAQPTDVIDGEDVISNFQAAAEAARDEGTLEEAYAEYVKPVEGKLFPPDLEQCDRIYRDALRRITG